MSNQDALQFDITEEGFDELFKQLGIEPEPEEEKEPAAPQKIAQPEPDPIPEPEPESPQEAAQEPEDFSFLFSDAPQLPETAEINHSEVENFDYAPIAALLGEEPMAQKQEKKPTEPKPSAPKAQARKKNVDSQQLPWHKTVILYLHDIAYLIAAVVVVFLLFFRVVVVSGTSMNNTLYDGDFLLLVSNMFYKDPQAGDVIVASKQSFDNGAPIVKRVIATEGQLVDIDFEKGIVYVDGVALDEPYTKTLTTTFEGVTFPLKVKEGCIFVLGDNRNDSKDSRSPDIGQIDTRQVVGKVIFLFLPGTNRGNEKFDLGRIGVIS